MGRPIGKKAKHGEKTALAIKLYEEILSKSNIPEGYCQCGCGGRTEISNLSDSRRPIVKGRPKLYIGRHKSRKQEVPYIINSNGCWVWQRAKKESGYGQMNINGKPVIAHRHYYEKYKGPIPEGLSLDHLCKNTSCVNPDHLEPVTTAENVRRSNNAKLTKEDVSYIIEKVTNGIPQKHLAKRFGVHPSHISKIMSGKKWVAI